MKRTAPAVAILAAAALVALLVYGVAAKETDRTIDDAIAHGERPRAPSRELPVLGAPGRRSLADYRGKVVVLNFWASWCEPCRIETPLLQRFQQTIATRGGTVLGVNFRDTEPDARAFEREFGLTYPSLRDVDGRLARDYGTVALPETFVIDRRGRIAARARGTIDRSFLEREVPPLLAEGP